MGRPRLLASCAMRCFIPSTLLPWASFIASVIRADSFCGRAGQHRRADQAKHTSKS